jgi:hypothetical protein
MRWFACVYSGFCRLQSDKSAEGRANAIADMREACDGGMDFGCKNVEALTKSFGKADHFAAAATAAGKSRDEASEDL